MTPLQTFLCVCVLGAADGDTAPQQAVVVDHGVRSYEGSGNRKISQQQVDLTCGKTTFTLHTNNTTVMGKDGKPERRYAFLGVQNTTGNQARDQGTGWYTNDTFHVWADGVDLNWRGGQFERLRILEQGRKALVQATLVHPKATVHIRLACVPGQDGIDVEIRVQAPKAIRSLEVRLSAYPAFFTSWNKRRGDRWVVTPSGRFEEPREPGLDMNARKWERVVRSEKLDPKEHPWLFYYDKWFNSSNGKGKGLCGLVMHPPELARIALDVSDYDIRTGLHVKPGRTTVRFTLWQQNVRDFAGPLRAYPAIAQRVGKRLTERWLFAPTAIAAFDVRAERARVREPDLRRLLDRAERAVRACRAAQAGTAADAEAKALEALRTYRWAVWTARRKQKRPLRVLAVVGAHYPTWKLEEACRQSDPRLLLDKSYFWFSYRGERLSSFPANEREMMNYDAVILVNVSTKPLREQGTALLEQFVSRGGGLLVCGGFYAYGGGHIRGTRLERMLPVTVGDPFDVKQLPSPAPIVTRDRVKGLSLKLGSSPSVVLWTHAIKPKPGVQVPLALETGQPFLVTGTHKQGRVAAITGTVYGEAPAGQTPFWVSPDWPGNMAALLGWVCRNP